MARSSQDTYRILYLHNAKQRTHIILFHNISSSFFLFNNHLLAIHNVKPLGVLAADVATLQVVDRTFNL